MADRPRARDGDEFPAIDADEDLTTDAGDGLTDGDGDDLTNGAGDDPRIDGDRLQVVAGDDGCGDVVLVGVVHDHPASAHRVRTVVGSVGPSTVAVELPPVALPAYRSRSRGDRTCEMHAALSAAPGRSVGIDGPSVRFLARLVRTAVAERADRTAVRRLFASTWTVSRRAVADRVAAALPWRSPGDEDRPSRDHDCDATDPPSVQAADERRAIRLGRSLNGVVEPAPAVRIRSRVREDHMAARLGALREEGDVVAVVGVAHLDGLVERLRGE